MAQNLRVVRSVPGTRQEEIERAFDSVVERFQTKEGMDWLARGALANGYISGERAQRYRIEEKTDDWADFEEMENNRRPFDFLKIWIDRRLYDDAMRNALAPKYGFRKTAIKIALVAAEELRSGSTPDREKAERYRADAKRLATENENRLLGVYIEELFRRNRFEEVRKFTDLLDEARQRAYARATLFVRPGNVEKILEST